MYREYMRLEAGVTEYGVQMRLNTVLPRQILIPCYGCLNVQLVWANDFDRFARCMISNTYVLGGRDMLKRRCAECMLQHLTGRSGSVAQRELEKSWWVPETSETKLSSVAYP